MPPQKQPSTSSLAHKIFEQLNYEQNKQQEYVSLEVLDPFFD